MRGAIAFAGLVSLLPAVGATAEAFDADQRGLRCDRFVLRPHGGEPLLGVMDLTHDLEQPLVVLPAPPAREGHERSPRVRTGDHGA